MYRSKDTRTARKVAKDRHTELTSEYEKIISMRHCLSDDRAFKDWTELRTHLANKNFKKAMRRAAENPAVPSITEAMYKHWKESAAKFARKQAKTVRKEEEEEADWFTQQTWNSSVKISGKSDCGIRDAILKVDSSRRLASSSPATDQDASQGMLILGLIMILMLVFYIFRKPLRSLFSRDKNASKGLRKIKKKPAMWHT